MIVGGVISTLFTVKVQVVLLPEASVAVSVTVIGPTENTAVPAAGDCVTVTVPQLSLAVARPV